MLREEWGSVVVFVYCPWNTHFKSQSRVLITKSLLTRHCRRQQCVSSAQRLLMESDITAVAQACMHLQPKQKRTESFR